MVNSPGIFIISLYQEELCSFSNAKLVFCFVVLISRISLGEHWTTDVIGGGLLGASFAFLSQVFLMKGKKKKKE